MLFKIKIYYINIINNYPTITEIFIFKEFMKESSFLAIYHLGSRPIGCTHPSIALVTLDPGTFSKQDPNNFKGMEKKSLYINPEKKAKNPISKIKYLT